MSRFPGRTFVHHALDELSRVCPEHSVLIGQISAAIHSPSEDEKVADQEAIRAHYAQLRDRLRSIQADTVDSDGEDGEEDRCVLLACDAIDDAINFLNKAETVALESQQ